MSAEAIDKVRVLTVSGKPFLIVEPTKDGLMIHEYGSEEELLKIKAALRRGAVLAYFVDYVEAHTGLEFKEKLDTGIKKAEEEH